MNTRRTLSVSGLVAAAFVAGILFTASGANLLGAGDRAVKTSVAAESMVDNPFGGTRIEGNTSIDDAFVRVADRVNPTVVQIRSERIQERTVVNPFEQFFGQVPGQGTPRSQEFRTNALGSGVFIREDGHIVTNNHVIEGADELEVMTWDGTFHDAEVIGTDPATDLAVIRIAEKGHTFPYVSFGSTDDIRIGQWALAFGSPLSESLGNTVTSGIISALRRTSQDLEQLNMFSSFIQTDAAINPGNSGGPLVNLNAELVGINSAIYSRSGGNQGIAFAIPVDVVANVTSQLIDTGSVERGFLGVNFAGVPESLARLQGVPRGAAQITQVTENSPAAKAGLQAGDLIIAVDGVGLRDFNELRTMIANLSPGQDVVLSLKRDEKQLDVTVQLAKRSEFLAESGDAATATPSTGRSSDMESLGLQLRPVTDAVLQQMGITGTDAQGVLISAIDQNSDAFREANLRQGDIIAEVDRKPVATDADFRKVYESIQPGEAFMVRALRPARAADNSVQLQSFFTALTKPN